MAIPLSGSLAGVRTSLTDLARAALELGQLEFIRSRRLLIGVATGVVLALLLIGTAVLMALASLAAVLAWVMPVPVALAIIAAVAAAVGVAFLLVALGRVRSRALFPHTRALLRETTVATKAQLREVKSE